MTCFRLWFYSRSGHISDVIELHAPDVEQAMRRAEFHVDGRRMELWQGRDRLHSWPAHAQPAWRP